MKKNFTIVKHVFENCYSDILLLFYSKLVLSQQVDLLKLSVFPVLKRFLGTDEGLDLKVMPTSSLIS